MFNFRFIEILAMYDATDFMLFVIKIWNVRVCLNPPMFVFSHPKEMWLAIAFY